MTARQKSARGWNRGILEENRSLSSLGGFLCKKGTTAMLEHLQSVPPWFVVVAALMISVVIIGAVGVLRRSLDARQTLLHGPLSGA